jgi:two-component system sensor histidine kinase PilS (NtrC family)
MREIKTAPPRSEDDWRAIRTLNLYRWIVAVVLCALLFSGFTGELLVLREPNLFATACIAYLLTCLAAAFAVYARRPALDAQVYLLTGTDVGFITLLVYASGGAAGGLGVLLLAPIAGASLLVPRRMAALFAAVASLSLILQEVYASLRFVDTGGEFLQAGILGTLLFISALAANTVAMRAQSSAALAAERKTALEDLAQLNQRIIQQMGIGLVLVDGERHVRLCNDAAQRMLGLREDPSGRRLSSAAPTLSWTLDAWRVSPGLSSEPFSVGEHALLPRFDRLGRDPDAPVLIYLEDARRISEQAQQMKLAALGRLTASIAHEIRNPLSAISHAGQLLDESGRLGEEERHLLDIQQRHARRIDGVIQNVLGLSRRGQALPTLLHLSDWLPLAVADYRHGHPEAPHFDLSGVEETVTVQVDAGHLRQVLHNLWENAERHARHPGGEPAISVRAGHGDDGEPLLEIADNGPGVSGEVAAHLMEPFFTTAGDGTGLGLYIARELCECNFARIVLISGEGETDYPGARFRITFARPEDWRTK